MDDEELIRLFEAGHVPAEGFHHREHVRAGWWYLRHHPFPDAFARFSSALRRFAVAQGKPELFHETITTAYMLVISERLDGMSAEGTWDQFAAAHPDLLVWRPSVLARYYRAETLASEKARRTFVMPDRLDPN